MKAPSPPRGGERRASDTGLVPPWVPEQPAGLPWGGLQTSPRCCAGVNRGPASAVAPAAPVPGCPRAERSVSPLCPHWAPPATRHVQRANWLLPRGEHSQAVCVDRGRGGMRASSSTHRVRLPKVAVAHAQQRGSTDDTRHGSSGCVAARHPTGRRSSPPGPSGRREQFLRRKVTGCRGRCGVPWLTFHTVDRCLAGLHVGSLLATLLVTGPCGRGAWTGSSHSKNNFRT